MSHICTGIGWSDDHGARLATPYEVLEEVQRDELRRKGWPWVEGWIAEEQAISSGEDDWISLRMGARGPQFQTAQGKDKEFQMIREEEVGHIEDVVT